MIEYGNNHLVWELVQDVRHEVDKAHMSQQLLPALKYSLKAAELAWMLLGLISL